MWCSFFAEQLYKKEKESCPLLRYVTGDTNCPADKMLSIQKILYTAFSECSVIFKLM